MYAVGSHLTVSRNPLLPFPLTDSPRLWPSVYFAVGSRVMLEMPHDGDFPFVGRGCWALTSPYSLEYTGNFGDFEQEDNEARIRDWHARGVPLYVTRSYVATYDGPESDGSSCRAVSVSDTRSSLCNRNSAVVFARNVRRATPAERARPQTARPQTARPQSARPNQ